jgi:hypothetical protein
MSKVWQAQPVLNKFNEKQLKKRYFIKKLTLLSITFVEFFIIFAVVWLLVTALIQDWAIHLKVGLVFGLLSGVLTIIPVLKSRITSYKMISKSTSDWIKFEEKMSKEAIHRGRFTRYLILAFSTALIVSFIYECFFIESSLNSLSLRYSVGIVWLVCGWFINRNQMKKHHKFLNTLE